MKLGNRFKNVDKQRVWLDTPYCVLCGSNKKCSLHHILGCKRDTDSSILNSSMLCDTHHREADGKNVSNREFQSHLLQITIKLVLRTNHIWSDKDTTFYNTNKHLYNLTNK